MMNKRNASVERKAREKGRKLASKKFCMFTRVLSILYLIALLAFESVLLALNVLPEKIMLLIVVCLAVVSVLLFMWLYFRNIKKGIKVIATIMSICMILVFGVGSYYAMNTLNFIGAVTTKKISSDAVDDITQDPFNIYVSGMDSKGEIDSGEKSRSDVNMIVTVNPRKKTILLTSIPRDYQIELPSHGYAEDKLTHSGLYGVDETIGAVENLMGIKINYYIKVNYTTFIELVNAIGGIYVTSDYEFDTYIDGYHIEKGVNYLHGEEALAFARERQAFIDGDNQRVKDQQIVLASIIDRVTSSNRWLMKYNKILSTLSPYIEMNLSRDEIQQLVKMQLSENINWKIKKSSLTGTDSTQSVYSSDTPVYVMVPDDTSVQEAADKINAMTKTGKSNNSN